ncbi:DNA cytosine methyltransferase [Kutzneria chonburiensis]|uniref:DNA (cytosine-5-)-methyltransferase n=1 Tax=Kutzneria chonburiensis TaxID=1483604 RepID=A0ABV6MKG9_9PSEU|nr:DNA cytosine methyltransferase [Kutzneria chonburiensis]
MSITFTDIFCGAGGSSIGLTAAGMTLKLAANHWDRAIETHAANFRDAEHLCADVNNYDMRRLPRTDGLWASPICTEISPAGGRRRTRGQTDLLEATGHVAGDAFTRTRATFMDVIRATEVHRYRFIIVENVVDVARDWELFDWWVGGMKLLGYQVQFVSVSAAHIGDDTNESAAQWRDRLFMVFTRDGVPLPDVDPRPPAWCPVCDEVVAAVQSWKRPDRRRIGKYGQQYLYRCPSARCRHSVVEPFVRPAAAIIDWSDPGSRIGDRRKPLAAATLRRIQAGVELFTRPSREAFTVPCGGTWRTDPVPVSTPMGARTTSESDGLVVPPFMLSVNHDDGGRHYPAHAAPLPTRSTKIGDGVVTPPAFVGVLRNHTRPAAVDRPVPTVAAGGNHHFLTVLPAEAGMDRQRMVIPYRKGSTPYPARTGPLSTVATREQHGVMHAAVDVEDCHFRMLSPREHLRAQRFPDSYRVTGNQGEQTMQAGNAVPANVAQWIGGRLLAVL